MKPVAKHILSLAVLPATVLMLASCAGVEVSGSAYTPVYGDYGYVGPWDRGRVEVEGGYIAAPPYGRSDRDRKDDHDRRDDHGPRREEPAPERNRVPEHSAPVQRTPPHIIPSIPNNPRPPPHRDGKERNH